MSEEFTINIPQWTIISGVAVISFAVVVWVLWLSCVAMDKRRELKSIAFLNDLFPGSWRRVYDLAIKAPSKSVARSIFHKMKEAPGNSFPRISLAAAQRLDRVLEEKEGGLTFTYYLLKYVNEEDFVDPGV